MADWQGTLESIKTQMLPVQTRNNMDHPTWEQHYYWWSTKIKLTKR